MPKRKQDWGYLKNMRRLFYTANNLDDVAEIVYSLEDRGISDKQFFVLSRDEMALRRRFIHGGKTLDNTRIVAASMRSNVFGLIGLGCFFLLALIFASYEHLFSYTTLVLGLMVFGFIKAATLIAGGMYDNYFLGVFNCKLDSGESIVVLDINNHQLSFVTNLFLEYPSTTLVVDSSNFASPLPSQKYIRRNLPR